MPPKTLDCILEGRSSQPNQLIEVLQDIQKEHGYISREAMETVSRSLGVPLIDVFRAASFYKAFRLSPSGKNILTICMGTACHVRGARLLQDQVSGQIGIGPGEVTEDGLFSVEHVNCMGACALGPIVSENGCCHHHMTPAKLRKLINIISEKEKEGKKDGQA